MSAFMPVHPLSGLGIWWFERRGAAEARSASVRPWRRAGAAPVQGPTASVRALGARGSSVLLADAERRLLHLHQELDVVARLAHPVEQQLQRLLGLQRRQHPRELENDRQSPWREEDLLLAGAGG